MDVIEFTKEEFEEKILPRYFTSGDQADHYYYSENGKNYILKKYRNLDDGLDDKQIKKIEIGSYLPNDFKMLRPLKLVMIDGVIVGFLSKLKKQYSSIDSLNLPIDAKTNILLHIKEIFIKLLNNGICFYDINAGNIIYNGKNILLCDVPDAYIFSNVGERIKDENLIELAYERLNLFTISYLNDIPFDQIKERLETLFTLWFNLKEHEELIGVTDNQNCMNICYDLLYNVNESRYRYDLLINYIDRNKAKQKTL